MLLTGDHQQPGDGVAAVAPLTLTAQRQRGEQQRHQAQRQADRHQRLGGNPPTCNTTHYIYIYIYILTYILSNINICIIQY